jgi:hydroxymethylpyrimidine pyrophosphatase-like HAD family hydrolase
MKQNKIVIFDLDGTLALIDKRRELSAKPNGKINWKTFFAPENIKLDEPNIPVITQFQLLKNAGFTMVIFSGRDSISIDETEKWLDTNGVDYDLIRMRPRGTHTPDNELKQTWLNELDVDGLTKQDVSCVFDDRDKVVNMWRDNGLTCFQVAEGNF